jgi:hypothetical protein
MIFKALFGSSGQGEADAQRAALAAKSDAQIKQALAQYAGITAPELQELDLSDIVTPELQGLLEAEQLSEPEMARLLVETDPRLQEMQDRSMLEMERRGQEGLSAEEMAMFDQLRRRGEADVTAREQSIKQDLAQRGMGGGRMEAIMRQQAAQDAANRAQEQGRQIAAQKLSAKRQAIEAAGRMAGGIEEAQYRRDLEQGLRRAGALDEVERMNMQTRMGVDAQNLAAQQRMHEEQIRLQNQAKLMEKQHNLQLPQQQFANQMALQGAKAGILSGQSNMTAQQAANVRAKSKGGLAPMIGAVAGGILGSAGGPEGIAMGASAGQMVGQGASSAFQKADGGVIKKYADGGAIESQTIPKEGNLKETYGKGKEMSQLKKLSKLLNAIDKYAEGGIVESKVGKEAKNTTQHKYNQEADNGSMEQLSDYIGREPNEYGFMIPKFQNFPTAVPTPYQLGQDVHTRNDSLNISDALRNRPYRFNSKDYGDAVERSKRMVALKRAAGLGHQSQSAPLLDAAMSDRKFETDPMLKAKIDASTKDVSEFDVNTASQSLEDNKPDMLEKSPESSLSKEDIGHYAQAIGAIGKGLAAMKSETVDPGYKALSPVSFAPLKANVQSTIKPATGAGLYAEGGIIESKVGQFRDEQVGQGNLYSTSASLKDMSTAYGDGLNQEESTYFRKQALADIAKMYASPVGNINSINKDDLKAGVNAARIGKGDQSFADGGMPKKDKIFSALKEFDRFVARGGDLGGEQKKRLVARIYGELSQYLSPDKAKALMSDSAARKTIIESLSSGSLSSKVGGSKMGVAAPSKMAKEFAEKELAERAAKTKMAKRGLAEEIVKRGTREAAEEAADKNIRQLIGASMFKKAAKKGAKKALGATVPLVGAAMEAFDAPDAAASELPLEIQEQHAIHNKAIKEIADKYACGGRVKEYMEGGIPVEGYDSDIDEEAIDGTSYVGDRVDAKVNSGELVLNLDQQQRLLDVLKGKMSPEELPEEDVVRPSTEEETNLHEKNEELEARLAAIEAMMGK